MQKTIKLAIEVNEGVWKDVELEFSTDPGAPLEFKEGQTIEGVGSDGDPIEFEVVRYSPKYGTVDLFSWEIGGLDTVKAKEIG